MLPAVDGSHYKDDDDDDDDDYQHPALPLHYDDGHKHQHQHHQRQHTRSTTTCDGHSRPRPNTMRTYVAVLALSLVLASGALLALSLPHAHPQPQPHSPATTAPRRHRTAYTAPLAFPTDVFPHGFWQSPNGTSVIPRPKIPDIVHGGIYPSDVDDPLRLPDLPPAQQAVFPRPSSQRGPTLREAQQAIEGVVAGIGTSDASMHTTDASIDTNDASMETTNASSASPNCTACQSALAIAQSLVRAHPHAGPELMTRLCVKYRFQSTKYGLSLEETCRREYSPQTVGAQMTQILSYADLSHGAQDGQAICYTLLNGACQRPAPSNLTQDAAWLHQWFGGKMQPSSPPPLHVGEPLNDDDDDDDDDDAGNEMLSVLALSDIHLDARFLLGAEAQCTSGQCCRSGAFNATLVNGTDFTSNGTANRIPASLSESATYWGNYLCDSPWPLVTSALESLAPLTRNNKPHMMLYTGDLVTHDQDWHMSHALVNAAEQALFDAIRAYLPAHVPVFPALGNHDSSPQNSMSQDALPEGHDTMSWNYDYLRKLWRAEGWLTAGDDDDDDDDDDDERADVRKHYGGYSLSPRKGLRIITINTDTYYGSNPWNVLNYSNPDASGTLRFLTDELQSAEDRGEAVWIVGHVFTGWTGNDSLDNGSELLRAILRRFAQTVRHVFFGHSHEDFFTVYYADGESRHASDAVAHAWVNPSITPNSRVNPSFGVYDVDPVTYEVHDHTVYYTQLVDAQRRVGEGEGEGESTRGPTWRKLYSAREAYSNFTTSYLAGNYSAPVALERTGPTHSYSYTWPASAPLNASFFAALTDEMAARAHRGDFSLSRAFVRFQGRNSSLTPTRCESEACALAKVCYLRAGVPSEGRACPAGYGSVQGG